MASDLVRGVNLGPEFLKGTPDGGPIPDKITIAVDGVSVIRNATTGVLSAVAPPADNFIQSGSTAAGDTSTALAPTITLVDGDATTPDIVIDASNISGPSTDAGNILAAGNDGKPRLTAADIPNEGVSTDAGNLLVNGADGKAQLNPAALPAQGPSTDANNLLSVGTDGRPMLTIAALCAAIDAGCVADSVDLFGNVIPDLRTF